MNGRSEDKVLAIVDAIRAEGGSVEPLVADVTDPAAVAQAVATIEQSGLPLELAIYNAGNNRPEAFLDVSPEIFEDMWRVLTMGAFLVSQQVIPLMRAQQDSTDRQTLLFTGASASLRGKANFAAFAAGKGALRMLAQSLAREFGPQGIHVAHVIIDGVVEGEKVRTHFTIHDSLGEDGALRIEAIADAYMTLHYQHRSAWTQEMISGPSKSSSERCSQQPLEALISALLRALFRVLQPTLVERLQNAGHRRLIGFDLFAREAL